MPTAAEYFKAGELHKALEQLQQEVRRQPADANLRIFLSQLLMVLGQWDRAVTQLKVLGEMQAAALPMVHSYQTAIRCEHVRLSVFRGERSPLVFGDPEPWIAWLIQAAALAAQGRHTQAADLAGRALEAAPPSSGSFNSERFEWLADADTRLGPILEVFLNGAYYWVPIHRVRRIEIETPSDIRDLVWVGAQFTWVNGGEAVGMIPVRYAGTEASADERCLVARNTLWEQPAEGLNLGTGQRLLATDAAEYGLLELRDLQLDVAP